MVKPCANKVSKPPPDVLRADDEEAGQVPSTERTALGLVAPAAAAFLEVQQQGLKGLLEDLEARVGPPPPPKETEEEQPKQQVGRDDDPPATSLSAEEPGLAEAALSGEEEGNGGVLLEEVLLRWTSLR